MRREILVKRVRLALYQFIFLSFSFAVKMSCEQISNFEIEIVFYEVSIANAEQDESSDNLVLKLSHMGMKVECEPSDAETMSFRNGTQSVDICFKLKNESGDATNEDFIFNSLGGRIHGK